jgi:hypothetical protein
MDSKRELVSNRSSGIERSNSFSKHELKDRKSNKEKDRKAISIKKTNVYITAAKNLEGILLFMIDDSLNIIFNNYRTNKSEYFKYFYC